MDYLLWNGLNQVARKWYFRWASVCVHVGVAGCVGGVGGEGIWIHLFLVKKCSAISPGFIRYHGVVDLKMGGTSFTVYWTCWFYVDWNWQFSCFHLSTSNISGNYIMCFALTTIWSLCGYSGCCVETMRFSTCSVWFNMVERESSQRRGFPFFPAENKKIIYQNLRQNQAKVLHKWNLHTFFCFMYLCFGLNFSPVFHVCWWSGSNQN